MVYLPDNYCITEMLTLLPTKNCNQYFKSIKPRKNGAPEEIRTPDPQIRSLVLYPAELRVHALATSLRCACRCLKGSLDNCKTKFQKKSNFYKKKIKTLIYNK